MAIQETYNFDDGTTQGWAITDTANLDISITTAAALGGSVYGVDFTAITTTNNDVFYQKSLGQTYADIYVAFRLCLHNTFRSQFANSIFNLMSFNQTSRFNRRYNLRLLESGGAGNWVLQDTLSSNTFALNQGVEYDIEIRFLRNPTVGGVQIWIDGILEIDSLTYNTDISDIGHLGFYIDQTNGNILSGGHMYIDEFKIADSRIGGLTLNPWYYYAQQ